MRRRARGVLLSLCGAMLSLGAFVPTAGAAVGTSVIGEWGTNGTVYTQTVTGGHLYIGGSFSRLVDSRTGQTIAASNLAAISPTTGAPLPWHPSTNGTVYKLAHSADGGTVYAGGTFTVANNRTRNRGAAFGSGSAELTSWNPNTNGSIMTILPVAGRVFAGGAFTTVGGASHQRLVSVDPTSGAVQNDWAGGADCTVRSLASDGTWLYVAGYFSSIDGAYQPGLAKVSAWTGARVSAFNAGMIANVGCDPQHHHEGTTPLDMTIYGDHLYLAIGGLRNLLMAVNTSSGARFWTDLSDGDFQTLMLLAGYIYAGGHFDTFVADPAGTHPGFIHAVRVNGFSGLVDTSWHPALSPTVPPYFFGCWTMTTDDHSLFAGGVFQSINGAPHRSFVILPG